MSEYRVGELVDITIKGARIRGFHNDDEMSIEYPAKNYAGGVIYASVVLAESVTIERTAPAEWPPQPGDVWKDRQGVLLFASRSGGQIDMHGESGSYVNPDYLLKEYSPLTLVYRRESDGGQS